MKIAFGSTNPAKLIAVKAALNAVLNNNNWEIVSVEVKSNVAEQPMSDAEAIKGAIHRAQTSLEKTNADIGIGLEGGLQQVGELWFTGNVACAVTKEGRKGYGISQKAATPSSFINEVKKGKNLTEAIHSITNISDIGKKDGLLGLMTNGLITRSSASEQAIIAALTMALNDKF